eukprot:GHVR01039358.1.p1 GENE.GHVR01039358.1~~GHVR01039358.1.p1  ORF type:complete len:198 (+),score=5.28 GHVR01039358.1:1022-1615(+)
MLNYERCGELIKSARNPNNGKPIGNNTRVLKRGDNYAVRLHDIDVLTFTPDGSVEYNTGGWRTVTTKARMNEYGPARIGSDRGTWKISIGGGGEWVYAEHCRVHDGRVDGAATDDKAEQKLRRQIAQYAKAYTDALYRREVPGPSSGDCWHCVMREEKNRQAFGRGNARPVAYHFPHRGILFCSLARLECARSFRRR